ncbi:nuclear transport factor 2 family protein [Nocardia rhizosphaerihabitans]|uniref:nuclear transport factor 2 family protein n=1 Tax=Nocardia rhizosphaerihabitans TaxID=1691570 RepID=UPI00366EBEF3
MTTSTLPQQPTESPVADLFLAALTRRDFAALTACLAPEVRLRGLIPPGPFDAVGPGPAVDRFRGWFGGPDDFTVLDAGSDHVGGKLALHWLVRMQPVHAPGAARVAEQRVFLTIEQDRITTIDLLCSGWQPAE